jgi:cytochrome c oxidase assembly factor CtaG
VGILLTAVVLTPGLAEPSRTAIAHVATPGVLALILIAGPLQGTAWYDYLALPWAPGRTYDQQLGTLLGLALNVATLLVLTATLLRWQRAAERHVRRAPRVPLGG